MDYLLVVLNAPDRCAIPLTVAVGHDYDDDNGSGVDRVNTLSGVSLQLDNS